MILKKFLLIIAGYFIGKIILDSLPLKLRNIILLLLGIGVLIWLILDIYKVIKNKKYSKVLQIVIADVVAFISFVMILYFALTTYNISILEITLGITAYILFLIAIVIRSFIKKSDNEGIE